MAMHASRQLYPKALWWRFVEVSNPGKIRLQSTSAAELDKVEEPNLEIPALKDSSLNPVVPIDGEDGPMALVRHDGELWDEERIARDVSRMFPHLRDRMDHVRKPPMKLFKFQDSVAYMRAQYAKFGRASGINPGIMWPSREEIGQIEQNEKDLGIPTLQESWSRVAEKRRFQQEKHEKREADVDRNMAKMGDEIRAFREKQRKAEEAVQAERDKRVKVMEEAKELLGYKVDPRDKRFQELVEQKEKEAKKLAKQQKKKEKEAKVIERLTSVDE